MKNITEEIWDYIDGNISVEDKNLIAGKIANDPAYQEAYTEMMEIHQMMGTIALEEPSMSFTRNVMEQVKLEITPVALKTKTDKRIIYSLAAFFLLSILSVTAYAFSTSTMTFPDMSFPTLNVQLNVSVFTKPLFLQLFLFVDVLLGLVYLDKFLRNKRGGTWKEN